MKWYQSLKTQIAAALILQVALVASIAGYSYFLLDLRKHDYSILNLTGQLRVISQAINTQSQNYKNSAPGNYSSYERDLALYNKDLQEHIRSYTEIIKSFEKRQLSAELTGSNEVIYCNWDKQSISALDNAANIWREFKLGLVSSLGDNVAEPKLEAAAKYAVQNGDKLNRSTYDLASSFQKMMEIKLDNISYMNNIAVIGFVVINIFILILFVYKVFKPLDLTRYNFSRVANGDLNFQVEVDSKNEISSLAKSFNSLTQRLAALFRLTDKIHQATNLDDSLRAFHDEFKSFLPIDLVGLIRCVPGTHQFTLERVYTDHECGLHENDKFHVSEQILQIAAHSNRPVDINQLDSEVDSRLLYELKQAQMYSVLVIPLECLSSDVVILLLAARESNAYEQHHLDFLENISAQLSHSLDKTIGMEGLVISTVEGLAKLAESRDPETGDHLTRMSLYSAIIAEQLAKDSPYSESVTPAYIRDIFRFSPMHDIGKVGIEDSILLKPGKLSDEERLEMQKHPVIGASVLQRCEQQMNALGHSIFNIGIEIAASHHERFDGTGYPDKIAGESIPLSARIVAAADVFDALTSKRPYKEAWSVEKAMNVMREDSGKHFDPIIISALEAAMPRVMEIYNEHKHI